MPAAQSPGETAMRPLFLTGLALAITTFAVALATRPHSESAAAEAKKKVVTIEASDVGEGTIIRGDLGLPIGEEVTIHGKKLANPLSAHTFLVDTVNYQKREQSRTVNVVGIQKWPAGTEATIRGYEEGMIRFLHAEDTNIAEGDATFKPHQFLGLSFRPIEVSKPKGLELAPDR
jgi:lipopolysaccharide export LptBFGC system permease protein LptF